LGTRAAVHRDVHQFAGSTSADTKHHLLRGHEDAELGRLAILLAFVGIALAGVTIHGTINAGAKDTPFPIAAHVDLMDEAGR
jgi:hypothetical protein